MRISHTKFHKNPTKGSELKGSTARTNVLLELTDKRTNKKQKAKNISTVKCGTYTHGVPEMCYSYATPRNRAASETLTVAQLHKNLSVFQGTQRFNIVFVTVHHRTLTPET
jgi:hypothetical protein